MSNNITHHLSAPGFAKRDGNRNDTSIRRWFASAFRNWQRRKMIATLEAMDDRLLRDMGIYRGTISQSVDGLVDRGTDELPPLPSNGRIEGEREALKRAA